CGGGDAFGEGEVLDLAALQNAIRICPNNFCTSRHNNPVGGSSVFGASWSGPSMFQDPGAAYACFRNLILGIDSSIGGGQGIIRGMLFWHVDLILMKIVHVTDCVDVELEAIVFNL